MSTTTKTGNSQPFPSFEFYLGMKKGCVITLVVLVIIGMIGMMYLGTTEWGHNVFEKTKAFLATQMTVRDVLYMVLGSVVGCGLIYATPSVIRRIDSICAHSCTKPVEIEMNPLDEIHESFDFNNEEDSAQELPGYVDPYWLDLFWFEPPMPTSSQSDTELSE